MRKALLVIDLQNDYLWQKRQKKFTYDSDKLISAVNRIIQQYKNDGYDIIYIAHIIQNIWTNRILFGFSIQGTEGAKLYDKLNVVSEYYFEKMLPDAFTSNKLKKVIVENKYDSIAICGLDECGCVSATAKGALKNGLSVEMVTDGIASVFSHKRVEKFRMKLKKQGVKYL